MPTDPLVVFSEGLLAETPQGHYVVALHEALDRLAEQDGRQAQVMTLRCFGGMTVADVAAAVGGSAVTVENDWRLARAWLAGQLGGWDG